MSLILQIGEPCVNQKSGTIMAGRAVSFFLFVPAFSPYTGWARP
jgi:hypothetical protein